MHSICAGMQEHIRSISADDRGSSSAQAEAATFQMHNYYVLRAPYMNSYLSTLCHIAYACSTMHGLAQSSAHYRILRTWYYAVEGDDGPVFV